jgi:Late embryogenesis abundant protein
MSGAVRGAGRRMLRRSSNMGSIVLSSRGWRLVGLSCVTCVLGGCVTGNFSNPTLGVESARVTDRDAALRLRVENPSSFNLTLTQIDYTLVYGPLPVATGTWSGSEALPKAGSAILPLNIEFTTPPLDPAATTVELSGTMRFKDATNWRMLKLRDASFSASAPVQR